MVEMTLVYEGGLHTQASATEKDGVSMALEPVSRSIWSSNHDAGSVDSSSI